MNLLRIKDSVKEILTRNEGCRESDTKLVANLWYHHLKKLHPNDFKTLSAMQLLEMVSKGTLPSADSITRCSRKLQEVNEELRGKNYNERQAEQVSVKKQLKQIK